MWHNRKFVRELALAETMNVLASEIREGGGERERERGRERERERLSIAM